MRRMSVLAGEVGGADGGRMREGGGGVIIDAEDIFFLKDAYQEVAQSTGTRGQTDTHMLRESEKL